LIHPLPAQQKIFATVIVKNSPIQGRGVYAARAFQKGEVVLVWEKARELSLQEYKALLESERHYIDFNHGKILLMAEPERYMNHSCDPNTFTGDKCDIASRPIKEGEEITSDYAKCNMPGVRMLCSCGSPLCRGIIIGEG